METYPIGVPGGTGVRRARRSARALSAAPEPTGHLGVPTDADRRYRVVPGLAVTGPAR
jgi:hypothetical protein